MAGNSVESLLTWMKDTTRLRGWDVVIALAADKVNSLLQHTYQRNLAQGVWRAVPDGSVLVPDTTVSHYFSGVVLGPPAMSLEHSSLESAPLAIRLAVVSGVHTVMTASLGQNSILRITAYEPLDGPQLKLDLRLDSQGPEIAVDLSQSEELSLQFPGTQIEQIEAGKFFQAWFENPENEERLYPLGLFADQSNPLLVVRRIDARSQLESPAEAIMANPKGALLLFVTMNHGAAGGFPDDEADFRYLIPDDDDHAYSATAVFSSHVLHRGALGHAVMQMLQTNEFQFIVPSAEPLVQMIAQAGTFEVSAGSYQSADFLFESETFNVPAVNAQQPLTIDFDYTQATQSWKFPCTLDFRYKALDAEDWTSQTGIFNVDLKHEFHLVADESGDRALEGHLYAPYSHNAEVSPAPGQLANLPASELQQINGFVAYTVKRALLGGLSQTLTVGASENFLAQWELLGEERMRPLVSALPHDLAMFGRIDAGEAPFSIVEQHALLAAGASLQFTTEPTRPGLNWTVENPPGSGGSPGTVSAQGIYQAPAAATMTQSFHRVLITASDPGTQRQSTALVTIQTNAISINPLIHVCGHGERVKLSAGILGGSALQWSIKNKVPDESGEVVPDDDPDGDHVYVARSQVAGKTYVLDEIEVSDGANARSAWILVIQHPPLLTVKPVEDGGLPEGKIGLQATANDTVIEGVQWSLPAGGPGSIDPATGVYTSSPTRLERFAVIFALFDDPVYGKAYGHLILPLPLSDFPDVLHALAGK